MPMAARPCVGIFDKSLSKKRIRPLDGLIRPMTLFMSVVLPAPLRPMRPVIAPGCSSSDTPRRICTAWIDTLSFSTFSMNPHYIAPHFGVGECCGGRRVGDDAAVVERQHAPGEARDDLHVVLDEEDGG